MVEYELHGHRHFIRYTQRKERGAGVLGNRPNSFAGTNSAVGVVSWVWYVVGSLAGYVGGRNISYLKAEVGTCEYALASEK